MQDHKIGALRVWWQPLGYHEKVFTFVESLDSAVVVMNALIDPGGIEMYTANGWEPLIKELDDVD